MKKIVQVSAIDMTMNNFLAPLNKVSKESGFEVHAACSAGNYVDDIKKDGLIFHDIKIDRKISPLSNLKSIYKLYTLFKAITPDIVHVHTPVAAVLGRVAARLARVPTVIYTAHGFYFHDDMNEKDYKFYFNIEKYMGRYFTDFIFTQSIEDHEIAKNNNFLKNKSNHIHISNGIDLDKRFNYESLSPKVREDIRKLHSIDEEDLVVTFIGRLVEEKGILDFLESINLLGSNNIKYIIIGSLPPGERDTDTFNKLKKFENDLNVIFTGQLENVNEYLYASDVFCLPSYREGMPRSIIEAMSMKNAVLATNIRGSREEVINNETGFLFEINDSQAIASYIDKLNNDRALLTKMQEKGYERAHKLYNEKDVVEKQLEIFNLVTNK